MTMKMQKLELFCDNENEKNWSYSVTVPNPIFQMMRRQPLSFFFRLRVLVEIFIALFHLNVLHDKGYKAISFCFFGGNSLDQMVSASCVCDLPLPSF